MGHNSTKTSNRGLERLIKGLREVNEIQRIDSVFAPFDATRATHHEERIKIVQETIKFLEDLKESGE